MLRRISPALVVLCAALVLPATSLAQATRTWVSGTGDDTNPCSRTAPCKTFAGAFSKTTVGGEIDAIDPAGYGTITITHAITIDGGGGQVASVLASSVPGITVTASNTDHVILRNLRINGINQYSFPGTVGVHFISGASLRLENVSIFGFSQDGVNDASTTNNSSLVVLNSTVANNGGNGVTVAPPVGKSAQATLESDSLENNQCGLAAGAFGGGGPGSNCGMATSGPAAASVTVSLASSSASSNTQDGVLSDGSPTTVYLSNASVFGNGTGLQSLSGGSIVSVGATNAIYGNGTDGTATSTVSTGAVGPQGPIGPQGPRGLIGLQGPAGKVVLVKCKTVTRKVKRRHHKTRTVKVQKCTAKPVNGPVTFTVSGHLARATLARDGAIYASGRFGLAGDSASGYLRSIKRVRPARYVLTLWRGRHMVSRRTIRVS